MPASILAEPRRRKQRLSIDPQNLHWRHTSNNNFGKKMLEQMGWQDGKGIGKNEQGSAENIRLKPNHVGKGLGENNNGKPEAWIAHNDDFASILASLNKRKIPKTKKLIDEEAAIVDDEVTICIPRKTKRVKRNVSVKHLSQCSNYEKAGIFGLSTKKAKKEAVFDPEPTETKIKNDVLFEEKNEKFDEIKDRNDEDIKTVISKVSMRDYFAAKMQQKFNKSNSTNEESPEKEVKISKKNRKDF